MNSFFIEFHDPLFGIIIFFVLVFVISLAGYWRARVRKREDYRYLERFLRTMKRPPTQADIQEQLASGVVSENSWLLIAEHFVQNGDYEKAIEIYQGLTEQRQEPHRQREILFLLGQAYFRAGFLERCEKILLRILRRFPRTPQALRLLLLTYEQLRDYRKALDVLEPLDELGSDMALDKRYLWTISLLNDASLELDDKCRQLATRYRETHGLTYLTFEFLFRHDPALAWQTLDPSQCTRITDILWHIPAEQLNMDVIAQHGFLRELYSARGDVDLAQNSSEFELDVLIKLHGRCDADLQFEYLCHRCKQLFPFSFHRCPHCHAIDSVVTEAVLTRGIHETSNTF